MRPFVRLQVTRFSHAWESCLHFQLFQEGDQGEINFDQLTKSNAPATRAVVVGKTLKPLNRWQNDKMTTKSEVTTLCTPGPIDALDAASGSKYQ